MILKTALLLLVVIKITTSGLYAQSLEPFVLSAAGGFATAGSYSLSHTTGEMTMVESFFAGTSILTQGFEQPQDGFTGITYPASDEYTLQVFPNPGTGNFYVNVASKEPVQVQLRILDIPGRLVWKTAGENPVTQYLYKMDLSRLGAGIYFLECSFLNKHDQQVLFKTKQLQILR